MDNVFDGLHKITSPDKEDISISKLLSTIQTDGSWSDINYSRTDITIWLPINHLTRLREMALAYTDNGNFHNNMDLYNAIIKGLAYWYAKDPRSKNWWFNEISTPQHLGELLIVMRYGGQQVPAELEASLIERMKRGDLYKQTGANKLDVAIHYLYRALLTSNKGLMDSAVEEAFQPISFTNQEGLQYDYSFMQHGKQLQISSYGAVFLGGEYKVASFLAGTPYALSGEKLKMLSNYYINSYLKALRGGYSDFNIEGRGISRVNALNKRNEKERLAQAASADPANSNEWNAAMARTSGEQPPSFMIKPSHTFFYCADYTLHTRPNYSFNVRMVSTRTKRTESGNGENLIGKFLPDGATDIQARGDEYYNIMPVWEWDKIPGTTARDFQDDQPTTSRWGEDGSTSFVGGVSDSIYGASVYTMDYNGVTAKKSWFFFDNEVVCLGAGINCLAPENVTTTINQCWLKGDVEVEGKKIKKNDIASYQNPKWVLHDGVGYYFPANGNIHLSTQEQTGNWYHINNSTPEKTVSGNVFKLWFDHGTNPINAQYAYIIVPDAKGNSLEAVNGSIKIISNTDALQAVQNKTLDITEAIIHKPCSLSIEGYTIKSNKPCALMVRDSKNGIKKIYIADPTQLESKGKITITNDRTHSSKEYSFHFPTGNAAGSSLLLEIE